MYGRPGRTPVCWGEVGERKLVGPEIVQVTTEKIEMIKANLKSARDRQKSYADNRKRDLEFEVGDRVLLKLSPWKGVLRFGRKGKLSPRYIGPFEILERVGQAAYRLALPMEMSKVHNVFHVSVLRKYVPDSTHVLEVQLIELREDLSYKKKPIWVLDEKEQVLRTKVIPLVKVLWRNHGVEKVTWEAKEQMIKHYPYFFFKELTVC